MKRVGLMCAAISSALVVLTACSGHMSAGKWRAVSGQTEEYSRLVVHFDGKAEIFSAAKKGESLRCFWQASNANEIGLKCSSKSTPDLDVILQLRIDDSKRGLLSGAGQELAVFDRVN